MKEKIEIYKQKLKECISNHDYEIAHYDADNILCDLLKDLGYKEIVDLWNEVGKWYA